MDNWGQDNWQGLALQGMYPDAGFHKFRSSRLPAFEPLSSRPIKRSLALELSETR